MKVIIRKLIYSFWYSYLGVSKAFKLELSFKLESYAAIIAILLAFFLPISITQKSHLIASVLLVLMIELINTSIERTIDYFGKGEKNETYGYIKDCGSGAVFLALCIAIVIWLGVIIELF